MLRKVRFVGPLADRFGKEPITFDCDDIRMLFSGLQCVYPDFRAELTKYDEVALLKKVGDKLEPIPEEELSFTFGKAEEIFFAAGTKGSSAEFAAWVASTVLELEGTAYAIAYAAAYVVATIAITAAMGAVMRSMMDAPSNEQNERDKHASNLFNGAQNVIEQGGAIPIVYGKHRVGATIISTEVTTERQAVVLSDSIQVIAGQPYTGNLLANDIMRDSLTLTGWTVNGTSFAPGATYSGIEHTVTVQSDGTIVVGTQSTTYTATLSLTYTVTTTDGRTATANVSVLILNISPWTNDGGGG